MWGSDVVQSVARQCKLVQGMQDAIFMTELQVVVGRGQRCNDLLDQLDRKVHNSKAAPIDFVRM
jgi:hypothetical protein